MNKIVNILNAIMSGKCGKEEFLQFSKTLSLEEVELLDCIVKFANHSAQLPAGLKRATAETAIGACGLLLESKNDKTPTDIIRAIGILCELEVNPLTISMLLHSIGIDFSKFDLIKDGKLNLSKLISSIKTCEYDSLEGIEEELRKSIDALDQTD